MSGRQFNDLGKPLFLGDSDIASTVFGFGGSGLLNVPKSKFMFYVKFYRPVGEGGQDWLRGIGFSLKSIDRPKINFETKVLNQYNRKRIVQTTSSFDAVNLRFLDTSNDIVRWMFEEYYNYYYGDPELQATYGSIYDVTALNNEGQGGWGLKTPYESKSDRYGHFFSHISIYQVFNNVVSQVDLINPKIASYDPDELDYSNGGSPSEVNMSIVFEGYVFRGMKRLKEDKSLMEDMALDKATFYDVQDMFMDPVVDPLNGIYDPVEGFQQSTFDGVKGILKNTAATLLRGGNVSVKTIAEDVLDTFDKGQGVASANLGVKSVKNIIKGNIKDGITGLEKLKVFGKPGKLF